MANSDPVPFRLLTDEEKARVANWPHLTQEQREGSLYLRRRKTILRVVANAILLFSLLGFHPQACHARGHTHKPHGPHHPR